jgi:choline dehydrogenase-like flavoprotein
MTSANYITKNNLRDNIEVLTHTLVDKILIESIDEVPEATGVEVVLADQTKAVFTARKEIILSAGAYGSPSILLRSGIGPREEVSKHNINHVLDLPGVGKNLQDHLVSCISPLISTDRILDCFYIL